MKNLIHILIYLLIILFLPFTGFADDAVYCGDGADVYPIEHSEIQLVSETILITDRHAFQMGIDKDYHLRWEVKVDMVFKNHGKATSLQMGFPLYCGRDEDGKIVDPGFRTWVNGKEVPIVRKRGIPNPIKGDGLVFSKNVFTYRVTFQEGEVKNISHIYKVGGLSNSSGEWHFSYILRTGVLWAKSIEELSIYYKTSISKVRDLYCTVPREHNAKQNGEQLFLSWYFKNYEPTTDLKISGGNIEIPANPIVIADPIDKLMNSNKRRFWNISGCSLRYLRNKILASHGYPFKNPYIRALFYYPSSPFKEDCTYSINKLTSEELLFLKYLKKIENWQNLLSRQRMKGLLNYETAYKKFDNRNIFEGSYLRPLIADPNHRVFVVLDYNHLLILSYPQAVPLKQIRLPLKSQLGGPYLKDIQRAISPDGQYLACGYHHYIRNVRDHRILIIDIKNGRVLQNISASVHESRKRITFDQNSSTLFTIEAAYDIATGKKIKKWILPDIPGLSNHMDSFQLFSGGTFKGDILFFSSSRSFNKIFLLNFDKGFYTELKDFKEPDISVSAGFISHDGKYIAVIVSREKRKGNQSFGIESRLIIYKWQTKKLKQIYEEDLDKSHNAFFRWGRDQYLFKVTRNRVNRHQLWRYEIINDTVSKPIKIPIELPKSWTSIDITHSFLKTSGRVWDIKTGEKIWPWYEILDPFDKSNHLPLYENKPFPVKIKDYRPQTGSDS